MYEKPQSLCLVAKALLKKGNFIYNLHYRLSYPNQFFQQRLQQI